jgi:hypothetical protein
LNLFCLIANSKVYCAAENIEKGKNKLPEAVFRNKMRSQNLCHPHDPTKIITTTKTQNLNPIKT